VRLTRGTGNEFLREGLGGVHARGTGQRGWVHGRAQSPK